MNRQRRWVRWLSLRILGALCVLWAAVTVTFAMIRLIPGDPAEAILGGPGSQASAEALAQVRADYALDSPVIVQYFRYLGQLATFNLGRSYALKENVSDLLASQALPSLSLAVLALLLAWAIAIVAVSIAALAPRIGAPLVAVSEVILTVMPHFWLGSVLIVVFSMSLGWLPAVSDLADFSGVVLPTVTLALPLAGFLGQVMRERLVDATDSAFAQAAISRGASNLAVLYRHTLRHAIVPAIGLSGWAFGFLVSGAVVVETVFARPGLGRLLMDAVLRRDIPVVTGVVLVVAFAFVIITIVTDALVRLIQPAASASSKGTQAGSEATIQDTKSVVA